MKANRHGFLPEFNLVVMFCFLLLAAGCQTEQDRSLTYKLWNNPSLHSIHEPTSQSHLALFEVPNGNDVLVQYDTWNDKRNQTERRAYFLKSNNSRIEAQKKPRFVDPSEADGLKVIPVVSSEITDTPSLKIYAVVSGDGQQFTLYRQNKNPEFHVLPVYHDASGNLKRAALAPLLVALTPITATGDLMTGALTPTATTTQALETTGEVVYWASFMWLLAGAPGVNY